MNHKYQKGKIVSSLLVLFLFSSIFSTFNVSADFVTEDNVLIYDIFNNSNDLDIMVNCSLQSGRITLDEGISSYEYDYAKKPEKIDVWDHKRIFLPDNNPLVEIISQHVPPNLLFGNSITSSSDLVKIGSLNDGKELSTIGHTNQKSASPIQHYRFTVENEEIGQISIKWWYGEFKNDSNLKNINMYVWNYGSVIPSWDNNCEVEYNDTKINRAGDIADLKFTFNGTDYINEDGYLDILIIGTPDHDGNQACLFTDFINLTVSTEKGYYPEGYIISTIVNPSDIGGWEKVFWESSEYSDKSGVTIHILDENKNLIEDFSSEDTPFDISNVDEKKIRLKAVLHSNSLDVTPKLYEWSVMWQKEDKYLDTFSSEYRIEESIGTVIESNEIRLSRYYNDWEFFGKKPDNTRQHDGKTIDSEPNSILWHTDYSFGGGFKSPVVSEGVVYVASSKDNKIYAFNETADSDVLKQKPFDESNEFPFEIDSCLAVADDYIIVGTANYSEKNKIYALDKNNLSNQAVIYESNKTICFLAPPTVYDNHIFVTSWSGRLWDLPFLSFVNKYLPGNNKLISISFNSLTPDTWETKEFNLTAGSLSAPAIGGGKIYVGCQNMYGDSVFAFDVDSLEEVWNQTVGIIGRSSPVFADNKVFILSNEKTNVTKAGDYKINCLNALDGTILWNKSIGKMEITNFVRGLKSTEFLYKLIEGFAPISTPTYYQDTLYVLAPNGTLLALSDNGEVKWSYDLSGGFIDLSFLSFYTTSPMVVGERLYVVTGNGNVFCFDVDEGQMIWKYPIRDPDEFILKFIPPDVVASPVLTDGLLFVSITENPTTLSGKIYCIGDYVPNSEGSVKSTIIHAPNGKWWDEFKAVKTNTTENTIQFSILDDNDNVLKTFTDYNGDYVDISDIKSNGIKIYASFDVSNTSDDYPTIDSWEVTWNPEMGTPIFMDETFEPGEEGWVNLDLKECSIEVKDTEYNDILSGLDIDSAEFRFGYRPKDSNIGKYSSWQPATSADSSGVEQTRIVADIESLNLEISEPLNITFRIRDLAGNLATSNITSFRVDTVEPSSEITGSLLDEYNDVFVVQAEAEDQAGFSGDTNISGISKVILKYQYKNSSSTTWGNWTIFTEKPLPFSCYFGKEEGTNDELISGYYRLLTIAVDKAGNYEELDNNKITDSFLLDLIQPELVNDFEEVSKQRELPTFSIEIQDDYELDGLYYQLDNQDDWNEIKSDIGQNNTIIEWTMKEDTWIEFREGIQRTVYFKITDKVGNTFVTDESDALKITKDESMNDLFVDLSDFSEWHWDETFDVTVEIPSEINVELIQLFYKYSDNNETWSEWKQVGFSKTDAPYSWDFTAVNRSGNYQFYVKVTDTSGAIYTSSVENIELTLLPLHHTVLVIVLATLLSIISIFVIIKVRSRKK